VLAIFQFIPSFISLLVSLLIYSLGQKLIKLSQAVKKCMSVNRNQSHAPHEVSNSLHHHKTEIYLPLNLGFWKARRETHKHKAHNIQLKIHKYLILAGQYTHSAVPGGEQPVPQRCIHKQLVTWRSFAEEVLSPEAIKEISWHGPWKLFFP